VFPDPKTSRAVVNSKSLSSLSAASKFMMHCRNFSHCQFETGQAPNFLLSIEAPMTRIFLGMLAWLSFVVAKPAMVGALPEYPAAESIAQAFVQAYSGADVDALARLYADRVDHTNSGVISHAAIRKQAQEYFARWPVRQWSLVGPVKTTSLGATKQRVIFSATYDASNQQTNKHASGIATETLIVARDTTGAMKVVSQREQTSKSSSGL
jgi:hypothetical protein